MNKATIVLVADHTYWAFANIAKQVKQRLGQYYHIEIVYMKDYQEKIDLFIDEIVAIKPDIIHFFWRHDLIELAIGVSLRGDDVISFFSNLKITFSVYDHLFLDKSDIALYAGLYTYLADGYTVCSDKLYKIYSDIILYPNPTCVIEDGVDPDLFYPYNKGRFVTKHSGYIVGWAGNSKWGDEDTHDHKGLATIIIPAIRNLKKKGHDITGRFADRSKGFISLERMVDYYNAIDIYVCASEHEGTPNPVLEAMACGVPIISTDVGIVSSVFGPLQQNFIVRQRTVDDFEMKMEQLLRDSHMMQEISEENLQQITGWTREVESHKWQLFFNQILSRPADSSIRKNKKICFSMPYAYSHNRVVKMKETISWKITQPLRAAGRFVLKRMRKYQMKG